MAFRFYNLAWVMISMLHQHIFQKQCTIATLFKTQIGKANSLSTNGYEDEHAPSFQDASPTPAVVVVVIVIDGGGGVRVIRTQSK